MIKNDQLFRLKCDYVVEKLANMSWQVSAICAVLIFFENEESAQPTMLCRAHAGPARAARTGPASIWRRAL